MDPEDSFENRLRALADQVARSLSDADIDDMAGRFGIDPDRVRGMTGAVESWLNDRRGEPLFGPESPTAARPSPDPTRDTPASGGTGGRVSGPHPLDLPSDAQGRTLAALDSGRWALRPGSGRLTGTGSGPDPDHEPAAEDLGGELRARDWVTADGAVTLLGRQALLRWSAAAAGAADSD